MGTQKQVNIMVLSKQDISYQSILCKEFKFSIKQ